MKLSTLVVPVALLALLLQGGCASKAPQPTWKANASSALTAFGEAYLKGDGAIAASEFARARAEMASTGRFDMVAHAHLYRCAVRVAVLEYDNCPDFDSLAADATAAQRAYAAYLTGRWGGMDVALLPEQHRAVVGAKSALATVPDPLARLVAAGALMQVGRLAPADIAVAASTASEQGWRRPLLTWLGVALKRAQATGDTAESARLQRRIDLAGLPGQ